MSAGTLSMVIIVTIVFVIILKVVKSSAHNKGVAGERAVAKVLSKLPSTEYKVLNDLMFKAGEKTIQIDHVVVSVYGIFIIETKAYTGIISGGEFAQTWSQNIYGKKFEHFNPIMQNRIHQRHLQHVLRKYGDLLYVPIVVFAGDAKLNINYNSSFVLKLHNLLPLIKTYTEVAIEPQILSSITHTILENNITDKKLRRLHIYAVQDSARRSRMSKVCPLCGSPLVVRNGSHGSFLGCSNYPQCKYTKNL